MKAKHIVLLALITSLLGGAISIFGYKYLIGEKYIYSAPSSSMPTVFSSYSADTTSIVVPEGLNFIHAADATRPAVVHIKTSYEVKNQGQSRSYPGGPMDQIFRDFFGEGFSIPERNYQSRPQEGSGSGVIISSDGYIITNNHVVENADNIEVILNDKRSYSGKLIGTDPSTDLALVKIEEKDLPTVVYGNSDNVKIGEWVLAVGNPFNLTSTVTAGIVSAKARNINILKSKDNLAIESFIQTDAVVNPGNSGGALVNLRGELIGINTAIASPTGSYAGYSFAVPVALVKKVVKDLAEYGAVQRALLGVSIMEINSSLAKEKGLKDVTGVYIASVNQGSAAEKAGLKEGDVITHVNEVAVNSSSALQENVARFRPGDKIRVKYVRNGKEHEVDAVLMNTKGNTELVKKEDISASAKAVGASLIDLSKEEMKKLGIDGGVKVTKLLPGKFKEAGIKEGFIITSVDKQKVKNAEDLMHYLDTNKSDGTLIGGIYPNGQKAYYAVAW
jgi:serine protease Do